MFFKKKIRGEHKDEQSLTSKAVSSFAWNFGAGLSRLGTGFIINIILARLLGPKPFGLVALSLVVVGLGNLIVDSGLGSGLIQKKDVSRREVDAVFTVQFLIGVFMALAICLSASWLSNELHNADAAPILRVMSLILVAKSFMQVPYSLLAREMAFKKIQGANITSYLISYLGLGLPLAFLGYGVWSLVAAQVSQSIMNALLDYFLAGHRVRFLLTIHKELYLFGIRVLGSNLLNWISGNLDSLLVGRAFGAAVLGIYNRAFYLVSLPSNVITSSAQNVVFSGVAKSQHDVEKVRKGYLAVTQMLALVAFPAFFSIAVIPSVVLLGLFGQKWLEGVPILVPLSITMAFNTISFMSGPILNGLGRPDKELKQTTYATAITFAVLVATSRFSMLFVAWGILASRVSYFLLITLPTIRLMELDIKRFLRNLWRPFSLGVVMAAIMFSSDILTRVYLGSREIRLAALLAIAFIAMASAAAFLKKRLVSDDVVEILGRFPKATPLLRWLTA